MIPAQALRLLDEQLADHGQLVAFRRGTTVVDNVPGFVRGYKAEQLVGLITQADRNVTVSPSGLGGFEPDTNDDFATNGRLGKVTASEPIYLDSVLVRWNITVRLT